MDPDVTPEPKKAKVPLTNILAPLKNLLAVFAALVALLPNLFAPLKNLPIPKKLVIPAIAGVVVLIAGGVAFGLMHAKLKHAGMPQAKAVASAPVVSATGSAAVVPATGSAAVVPATGSAAVVPATGSSAGCSGVVRDIYRQTVDEDPSVTLAEVRSEVLSSGVSCVPVPEIAAELKDLSPACRDMIQYTYLGVRDGHLDIKVSDIREKVVQKSVACEHDRAPNIASVARHKAK